MELLIQVGLLIAGFALLVKGADWFVEGASKIADRFGIPQLVIGLTIVAMGTSAPEAAVSITAALNDSADITIGNIVGSNIMNVLVILGLSAAIIPLAVAKSTVRIEIPFLIGITVVLYLLGMDGTVSLWDGLILVALFLVYLGYLLYMAKKNPSDEEAAKPMKLWVALVATVGGMAMIVLGSDLAVDAAKAIASALGIPDAIIGLTVVALGTSLPELFTSVIAACKGKADIAIGNIVGSNIFNILFVVSTSALIIPVVFASSFMVDCLVAAAAGVVLWLCTFRHKKLTRAGGILMLVCYAAYFAYLLIK